MDENVSADPRPAPTERAALTGEQRRRMHEVLLQAFPDPAPLSRMVSFGLNKNLAAIAGGGRSLRRGI